MEGGGVREKGMGGGRKGRRVGKGEEGRAGSTHLQRRASSFFETCRRPWLECVVQQQGGYIEHLV